MNAARVLLLAPEAAPAELGTGLPRMFLPIQNRSLLEHNLDLIQRNGLAEVYLCLGNYRQPWVRQSAQASSPLPLHCLQNIADLAALLSDLAAETPILVLASDALTDYPLETLLAEHWAWGLPVSVAEGESSQIGVWAASAGILRPFAATAFARPHQLLSELLQARTIARTQHLAGSFTEIPTVEAYLQAHRERAVAHAPVGKGCLIAPSASLSPLARIGPGCRIGPGAVIAGASCLAAGCVVSADAYLHDAVLWEGAKVGVQAQLSDCAVAREAVIARAAQISAGAVVPELAYLPPGACLTGSLGQPQAEVPV